MKDEENRIVAINGDIFNDNIFFECGRGWNDILECLVQSIDDVLDEDESEKMNVVQVKQKFGALEFYCFFDDDFEKADTIRSLISMARKMSQRVCEYCGDAASRRSIGGWYVTICEDCYDKRNNQNDS